MFASQYVFVTLLAVVLVCSSVTDLPLSLPGPKSLPACTVDGKQYPLYAKWPSTKPGECAQYTYCDSHINKPPPACTVDGKQYPLNAKWPSTKPGECGEYTCIGHNQIAGVGCVSYDVLPEPGQVCSYIAQKDAPYPDCCPKYHCVKKSEDSAS